MAASRVTSLSAAALALLGAAAIVLVIAVPVAMMIALQTWVPGSIRWDSWWSLAGCAALGTLVASVGKRLIVRVAYALRQGRRGSSALDAWASVLAGVAGYGLAVSATPWVEATWPVIIVLGAAEGVLDYVADRVLGRRRRAFTPPSSS